MLKEHRGRSSSFLEGCMRVCLGHIEGKIPEREECISRGIAVGKGAVSRSGSEIAQWVGGELEAELRPGLKGLVGLESHRQKKSIRDG